MDSIYWVVSRHCNQRCTHCYNNSEPGAPGLTCDEASRCIDNMPVPDDVPVGRFILSGGEVLVWPELLFHTLERLHARHGDQSQLWVQTNGDLLDAPTLDRLLEHRVCRVDVSSIDHYHPKSTLERQGGLTELFQSRQMVPAGDGDSAPLSYAFWGATEEQ